MLPLRDGGEQDILEGSRILRELLDWHEGQIVAWKTTNPMKVMFLSMLSWDHPFGHSEKNVDECILECLLLARYAHGSMVLPVKEVGIPCGRSIYPKISRNRRTLDLEAVEQAPFVSAMEEQIRRRGRLEDSTQQTAMYSRPDLTDERYLQKKEQKEGEIVLLIK